MAGCWAVREGPCTASRGLLRARFGPFQALCEAMCMGVRRSAWGYSYSRIAFSADFEPPSGRRQVAPGAAEVSLPGPSGPSLGAVPEHPRRAPKPVEISSSLFRAQRPPGCPQPELAGGPGPPRPGPPRPTRPQSSRPGPSPAAPPAQRQRRLAAALALPRGRRRPGPRQAGSLGCGKASAFARAGCLQRGGGDAPLCPAPLACCPRCRAWSSRTRHPTVRSCRWRRSKGAPFGRRSFVCRHGRTPVVGCASSASLRGFGQDAVEHLGHQASLARRELLELLHLALELRGRPALLPLG